MTAKGKMPKVFSRRFWRHPVVYIGEGRLTRKGGRFLARKGILHRAGQAFGFGLCGAINSTQHTGFARGPYTPALKDRVSPAKG